MTSLTQIKDQFGLHKSKSLIVAAIPAFNEERTIAKLVLEVQKHVDVVLVCDDGSNDCTAEIAERIFPVYIVDEEISDGKDPFLFFFIQRIKEYPVEVYPVGFLDTLVENVGYFSDMFFVDTL